MYTTNQDGLLNNYAVETPVYYAEYPSEWQQRQYLLQGAVGALITTAIFVIAIAVS